MAFVGGRWQLPGPVYKPLVGVVLLVAGLRPVVDLMFMDFIGECMDEIANQMAKMRYMFGGAATLPVTVLTMAGAGQNLAAQHSQSLEAWLAHLPGIKVVCPVSQNCPTLAVALDGQLMEGTLQAPYLPEPKVQESPKESFAQKRLRMDRGETELTRRSKPASAQSHDAPQSKPQEQTHDLPSSIGQKTPQGEKGAAPEAKSLPKRKARPRRQSKRITAPSSKHNIFTHFPKDPDCDICQRCKPQRDHCRSKVSERMDGLPIPTKFCEQCRGDHKILNDDNKSRTFDKNVFVIKYLFWREIGVQDVFDRSPSHALFFF